MLTTPRRWIALACVVIVLSIVAIGVGRLHRVSELAPNETPEARESAPSPAVTSQASLREATLRDDSMRRDLSELSAPQIWTQPHEIRGRLVNVRSEALPRWLVSTHRKDGALDGPTRPSAFTDSRGEFVVANCTGSLYDLDFHEQATRSNKVLLTRAGVVPGGSELLVVAPENVIATAWIRGRVSRGDGRSCAGVHFGAGEGPNFELRFPIDASTGAFEAGPLPPGDYELRTRSEELGRFEIGAHSLEPKEVLELGTITIPSPGMVRLDVVYPKDAPDDDGVIFYVSVADRPYGSRVLTDSRLARVGDRFRSGPLAPGLYVVRCVGSRFGSNPVVVEVVPGKSSEAKIDMQLGASTVVHFTPPPGRGVGEVVGFQVVAPNGVSLVDIRGDGYFQLPCRFSFKALPQRYRIIASTSSGLAGERWIEPSTEPSAAHEFDVALR